MFHPFTEDTKDMTLNEIYDKISDLTKKYFQAHNPEVKQQIQTFLDFYKQEARIKEEKIKLEEQDQENGNIDLDKLINVQ
tara:strand:- start:4699 stop:4938 length:240 start_codon:yes stop_codon:yes gene_type:complete